MERRRRKHYGRIKAIVAWPLGGCGLGCLVLCAMGFTPSFLLSLWSAGRETQFDQTKSSQIIAGLQQGTFKPGVAGQVALPTNLASAAVNGKVYVTHKGQSLLVLFPAWLGHGGDVNGYLYSSRPLLPCDMTPNSGVIGGTIEIFTPIDVWAAHALNSQSGTTKKAVPEPSGVFVDRQRSANWYDISTHRMG